MDLQQVLTESGVIDAVDDDTPKSSDFPDVFVAPRPSSVPTDGFLNYVAVTNVYDTESRRPGTVFTFDDDAASIALLALFVANSDVFEARPVVLEGVPDAAYGPGFKDATVSAIACSYQVLITDLAESKRVNDLLNDTTRGQFDKERDQVTNKSGAIRDMSEVQLHLDEDAVGDDEALL